MMQTARKVWEDRIAALDPKTPLAVRSLAPVGCLYHHLAAWLEQQEKQVADDLAETTSWGQRLPS